MMEAVVVQLEDRNLSGDACEYIAQLGQGRKKLSGN